jgi:hypothetical protein
MLGYFNVKARREDILQAIFGDVSLHETNNGSDVAVVNFCDIEKS